MLQQQGYDNMGVQSEARTNSSKSARSRQDRLPPLGQFDVRVRKLTVSNTEKDYLEMENLGSSDRKTEMIDKAEPDPTATLTISLNCHLEI